MNVINYTIRDYSGIKIMDLAGSLNSNTISGFQKAVKVIADKESLILNLSNVEMITTAGLNALIDLSYYAKDNGKRLVIMWPSDELIRMVDSVDVYSSLIFADSPEEGITKIKHFVQ
jgi:anti-anti-sigma factor